ncbi:MAG: tripartite tricarboxylate transporter substrate binding protein [Betaproteobacteria bacterium]|nr:tripartite tricarboxylate transporter substrate binding protein [Betaproteobacteria bacterium]
MKPITRIIRGIVAVAATAVLSLPAAAQTIQGPIEFVIPFGAGGGADIEGRLLAEEMSKVLGVPVVPVNKPGAGGAVTYTYVKNAKPDGRTIAWNSTSILTTTNIGNVPFEHSALDHIGQVEYQPMPFAVRADAPWKTMKDFAADCQKHPGKYKIANSTTGSATHLAAIAVANAIGCDVIHLPAGIKRRNATVLSGEADAMIAPLTGAIKLAKAGKIRLLAIPSPKRNPVIPDVPTMKELGYDADILLFRGLSVPKGTPSATKAKLADAMTKAAHSKAFMDFAAKNGFTVETLSVDDFEKVLQAEDAKVKDIMKTAGLYHSKKK